jgi:hypothetical protein
MYQGLYQLASSLWNVFRAKGDGVSPTVTGNNRVVDLLHLDTRRSEVVGFMPTERLGLQVPPTPAAQTIESRPQTSAQSPDNFGRVEERTKLMKGFGILVGIALFPGLAIASSTCDVKDYKAVDGIRMEQFGGTVALVWQGESGQELRARLGIADGHPVVSELAAREKGGRWVSLGKDLTPEFQVTTGKRRISRTQVMLMKKLGIDSPEEEDKRKWNTFWDAPLAVPGHADSYPLPRNADEIKRAASSYKTDACSVSSDGNQVSVSFNGLSLGVFSGSVRFIVYKGSNLLRQEAVASTSEASVAFIYKAGLKGFSIGEDTKLAWRDTARQWQSYAFGGEPNQNPVNLRARNRMEILSSGKGSLAIFPPPHKFFFARENEVNLGYVYYRKDNDHSFSLGVMQPEKGEGYAAWGATEAEFKRRTNTSFEEWENFALYNAPPGTEQRMAIYYYLSPKDDHATDEAVLAYTHNDVFKPLPGFKVLTGHFHLDLNEQLRDRDNLDYQISSMPVFRGLGVNIVYLGDFHDDSDPRDPGPKRLMEEKAYFDGAARASDKDFLVIPAEEANAYFGGHWYMMTPKPVYFSHAEPRPDGQSFEENDPTYGHVYHLGSSEDVLNMINREQGIMWTAHPRTKSSEGYPEAYKSQDFFQSDRFIGASWESLPVDLSETELCQTRCFGTGDDMSNWAPKPKFLLAEGDTYTKYPSDETYPQLAINYLKLDRVPLYNESWAPVVEGIRAGNFYGTTGEVLFHDWGVQGSGANSAYTASIEYTFPLQSAELVWSDGTRVERKMISLTDSTPYGTKTFKIPFDATGKKWVRFSVWDSAGDGAYVQPIALNSGRAMSAGQ